MLHLALPTDDQWLPRVLPHLDELLIEQAHLEKKAAAGALQYLFRYPDLPSLQLPLSELAREELTHFERMLQVLKDRGVVFGRQRPSTYAEELLTVVRREEPHRLLDSLLCSAAIEARSCERMRLLARALVEVDPGLAAIYHELVVSEARHHGLFLRLAKELFPEEQVTARLMDVLAHEAMVVQNVAPGPRLHS